MTRLSNTKWISKLKILLDATLSSSFAPITKVDMQLIAEILKHLVKDGNMELMSMQAFIEYEYL